MPLRATVAERQSPEIDSNPADDRSLCAPQRKSHGAAPDATDDKDALAVCGGLAGRQRGIVTHGQLLHAGVDASTVKRLVRRGFLHRLYRGVYAVGHLALAPLGQEQAALLAYGPQAVLSHATAAFVWGLRPTQPSTLHVTLMAGQRRPRNGTRVHCANLDTRDLRRRHGLRITSPARTLIDLAADVSIEQLEELVAQARVRRLIRPGELEAALTRAGRRRGAGRMRAFLRYEGEPEMTRSRAERIVRTLCRRGGLSQPRVNVKVLGMEVDFVWREERLILEVDGFQFHGHRKAFEDARRRDMVLADAGYEVIRITWRQLTREPLVVLAHIARAMGRRTASVC